MSCSPTVVAGADNTRGRWVVVVLENGRCNTALLARSLSEVPDLLGPIDLLAIDIPIGLPLTGDDWPRPADLEARELVGPRRSSVFPSPPRPVLDEPGYPAANALHRRLTGKGLSRQTWGLRAKILEAAAFITDHPDTIEAHPEVCFRAMKGEPLTHSKKTWNGQMERRALLAAHGIELPDRLDDLVGATPADDILDAAAAAWTADRCLRGEAQVLPTDSSGSPIRHRGVIWY
jgi:predicted RNase H-like nuclease